MSSSSLPSALSDALHRLDWDLGLRYDAMLASPIWSSEPYLLLAYHIAAQADEFAGRYNGALDQFRQQEKIRSPGRPMPNLTMAANLVEIPFWLDSLASDTRTRAQVVSEEGKWTVRLEGGDRFQFESSVDGWTGASALLRWLGKNGLRLSPRALMLTLVFRLLVADQFVHGIGGAQYDRVLDLLMARWLGIEPPRFAVTTATLYFPDAVGQPRICLPCIAQEGHRLRHAALGEEKMRMVHQIESLPRRSPQRSKLFMEMRDKLAESWSLPRIRDWAQRFEAAREQTQAQRVLFDRELFYGIQSRQRLADLIERYRQLIA